MKKGRLEAFSDGVIAIIITIMVLEMKAPEDTTAASLLPVLPVFFSYVLSFVYVGIYWINHHQIIAAVETISPGALWTNLHLLFWMSLIPFATSWLGENHLSALPMALYGGVLMMCAVAFFILERSLMRANPDNKEVCEALGPGKREKISVLLYLAGIPLAYVHIGFSVAIYIFVAIIWLFPSKSWRKVFSRN